jgi:transcriptional regulator with XRE-family HTH domain
MRKAAIPVREISVLKRLREARERIGLNQPDFAAQAGISRGRFANYEYLKAPLPLVLGLRICHQFIIGERWLATGEGPFRRLMDLRYLPSRYMTNYTAPKALELVSDRHSFGEGFDRYYASYAKKASKEMDQQGELFTVSKFGAAIENNRAFSKNYCDALVEHWMSSLDEERFEIFTRLLSKAGTQLARDLVNSDIIYDEEKHTRHLVKATGERFDVDPFSGDLKAIVEDVLEDLKGVGQAGPEAEKVVVKEIKSKK